MTDVLALLRRHTSCRDYTSESIPDAVIEDLVRAAQQSSTDATGQLYSVVRLKDPTHRRTIGELAGDQGHVHTAAEHLIILLDTHRLRLLLEHRGERFGMKPLIALLFGITDATIFAQSLTLAAESMGYGLCYIGGVQNNTRDIAKLLALPPGVIPLYGLTIGRPKSALPPKPRLPIDQVIHIDRYQSPTASDLDLTFEIMARATRSGDWLNPIRKYFAEGGIMAEREKEFWDLLEQQGLSPQKP
jgi:FMN reductase (NADPH)